MNILWNIVFNMLLPIGIKIAQLRKRLYLLTAIVFLCNSLQGQEYDSIANKYKNENAVITNYTERLVITYEEDDLVPNNYVLAAKSYVTIQKLMISDLAPGIFNQEYIAHSSLHELSDIEANRSNPSKTGYKKTRCYNIGDVRSDKDPIFYDDNRYAVVDFSGLVKKSVTEVKYVIEHSDPHMLPSFDFQDDIPIVKARFEVVVPKYVDIDFVLKGEHTSWIKQTKEEGSATITYIFTAEDVPAFKTFSGVPSTAYYIPHVIPYIKSYKRYAEDKPREMLANPDQLYKYLYKFISHINMVADTLIDSTVAKITKNDHTQREKAAHIYKWVQKNMHYIAFENGLEGFIPREAKLVCKRKYGDCKDMASILVAMCRKAGIDAHYTWIGTRHLPYTNEETPIPSVNNHMICTIKLDGEWVFMDGTHPLIPFGVNPAGIQGKEAMIAIDTTHYKIVTVPEVAADKNTTVDSTFISIGDNQIKGTVKQEYKGYEAWQIGVTMMYVKNDDREKYVKRLTERGSNKYQQTRYDISASNTGNKDVAVTADFTIDDYPQKEGKQYYINMNLNREFENKHIDTKDRTVPYFYNYKEKTQEVVVLDIPKGYKVTYLPKNAQGSVDGMWGYKISYKADKKQVTLVKEYELNTMAIGQKQFADNNKMVDDLKKIYKESVVLIATK
ncbi:MAG: transglutaminase domain-containing protein [Chitinophagales bacterium]